MSTPMISLDDWRDWEARGMTREEATEAALEPLEGETDEGRVSRRLLRMNRLLAFHFGSMTPPPKSDRFRERIPSVTWDEFRANIVRLEAKWGVMPGWGAAQEPARQISDRFGADVPDSYRKPYAD